MDSPWDDSSFSDPPPSYDDAVTSTIWPKIISFLPHDDVLTLGRVSQKMARLVQQHIWTNPRLFWPSDPDVAFVTLHRFVGCVRQCRDLRSQTGRPSPARFTTILGLSGLGRETFAVGLGNSWLRILLLELTNLRCLSFAGSSLFDPSAVDQLEHLCFPHLAMLDVSRCPNLVVSTLDGIPKWAPNLWYLDISENTGMGRWYTDNHLLKFRQRFRHLSVLSVRGGAAMGVSTTDFLSVHPHDNPISALDLRDPQFNPSHSVPLSLRSDRTDRYLPLVYFQAVPNIPPSTLPVENVFHRRLSAAEMGVLMETRIHMSANPWMQQHNLLERTDFLARQRALVPGWWTRPVYLGLAQLRLSGPWENLVPYAKLLVHLPLTIFDCGDVSPSQRRPPDLTGCEAILMAVRHCPSLQLLRCPHQVFTGKAEVWKMPLQQPGQVHGNNFGASPNRDQSEALSPIAPFLLHPQVLSIPEIALTNISLSRPCQMIFLSAQIAVYCAEMWSRMCAAYLARRDSLLSDPTTFPFLDTTVGPTEQRHGFLATVSKADLVGHALHQARMLQLAGVEPYRIPLEEQPYSMHRLILEIERPNQVARDDVDDERFSFFDFDTRLTLEDHDEGHDGGPVVEQTINLSECDSLAGVDRSGLDRSQAEAFSGLHRFCRSQRLSSGTVSGVLQADPYQSFFQNMLGVSSLPAWKGDVLATLRSLRRASEPDF